MMNATRRRDKNMSVTIKLQLVVFAIVLLIIGIQTWLNIHNARQRNETETKQHLITLYHEFNEEIKLLERTAATLSLSFAHRSDIQERFQVKDRQGLLTLLESVFTTLKTGYNIVHLQFHEPNGRIFLRIHNPEQYGDYTFTYRRANAIAIISRKTVAGIEIDPNRLGIQGVSPMFHKGQFIGLLEVGLDYDQAFLEDLKTRQDVDYTMWVTHKDAAPAELRPVVGAPESPSPEIFYYAGTNPTPLPISAEIYHAVLQRGEPQIQFVSDDSRELAVLIAPILSYGDRVIGILEISRLRMDALAALQRSQRTTLTVAGGLALLALVLMWISTRLVVLRPLGHLTAVAHRQLEGELTARVKLLPGDEFGHLGHTLNVLTETLDNILKNQEHIIAERTGELKQINTRLQQEIIEHKRAEKALRESEERFRSIFLQSPIGIELYDKEGYLIDVNTTCLDMFGLKDLEAVKGFKLFEDPNLPRDAKRRLFNGESVRYEIMFDFELVKEQNLYETTKSGQCFLECFITQWGSGSGDPKGFLVHVTDITERKRTEERIKNQNILLEQAVQEKQQEMEALFERMLRQEKLATIGQMAGSIAHELRNPLGAVKQSAFFLKRLYDRQKLEASNPKVQEHLELIKHELDTSEQVIAYLLKMTHMKPIQREQTDLRPIIEDAAERCQFPEQIRLTLDLNPEPFLIWADHLQLRQVFINILTNAVQAIEQDGNITIRATQLTQEKSTTIEIENDGLGIEPDALDKVFEPLYTTKTTGAGLGLSICKQIIENHQGHISIRSSINQGTTVTIVLPGQEWEENL